LGVRDGLAWYYGNYGLRGVLAVSAYRLFRQPKEFAAYPPGFRNPVYLRIKTSDESAYAQTLLWGQYTVDLPFSPKVIVDAGANIGTASIYFTHKYPQARIIAIEPEASNYAMLTRNIRPYPAIIPVQAALWSRDGEIGIGEADPTSGVSGNWAFVTGDRPSVKVRAMTMPTLMKEMKIPGIELVKIDIEGAELEVFKDSGWLRTVRCLMIELHDRFRPGCSEAVEPVMQGFSRSKRGETTFFIRE